MATHKLQHLAPACERSCSHWGCMAARYGALPSLGMVCSSPTQCKHASSAFSVMLMQPFCTSGLLQVLRQQSTTSCSDATPCSCPSLRTPASRCCWPSCRSWATPT
ncbi:hypothetical protein QJQ45_008174 [Haematococcus lacustris]|nr:hypothetical protein QJQ45_008174 [Haematococcus lacustris]